MRFRRLRIPSLTAARGLSQCLLAIAIATGLVGPARVALANDGAPCPPAMRFAGGAGAEIDSGFTGFYHNRELVGYLLNVAIDTASCDGTTQPTCGECALQALLPNAGGSNERCVGDTSLVCNADSDCGGAGPCRFFATPPLAVSGGGIGVCLTNEITANISGTVNIEAGRMAIDVPQKTTIHLGSNDEPCPVCLGDTTPNDGVPDGTCAAGARVGLTCDTNAESVSYGATSFDCAPSNAIGTLVLDSDPIRISTESADATRTLTTASPTCTALGFSSFRCLCGTCTTGEPCSADSDCPAAGTCTGTSGTPTKPNTCFSTSCTAGECTTGPLDGTCGPVETFRLCLAATDCPFPGDTCTFQPRSCFSDNGVLGGSVTVPVAADPLGSSSNTISPSTGALFCAPSSGGAAVDAQGGLPALTRLSFPASSIVFGEEIVEGIAGPSQLVSSDTEGDGATPSDRIETTVTTSDGQPGVTDVEIIETYHTDAPPAGFELLGRLVQLTVPDGTAAEPLTVSFVIDATEITAQNLGEIEVRRNGVLVPDCTGAPQAIPDPCVSLRQPLAGGDVRIEALSSAASDWDVLQAPPMPAPLTKDQQKCVNGLNKDLLKIDKTVSKQITGCLKNHAKGAPLNKTNPAIDTLEECVDDDPKGKILNGQTKAGTAFTKNCTPPPTGKLDDGFFPAFGATDATTVGDAATEKGRTLVHDVFGPDLDTGVLVTQSVDSDKAACQTAVWKAAVKCQQTKLKEFVKCKKDGFKGKTPPGLLMSADDLRDLCLGTGTSGQPDAKGKIAKKCADPEKGIHKDMLKKCVDKGLDPSELFPPCADADPLTVSLCIEAAVECAVCVALNTADDLTRDCDSFDDGVVNGSCAGVPTPTPTPTPTLTPTPTPTSTTIPAACEATTGGFCWFLGAPGADCNATCSAAGRSYDTATGTYAGSGGTDQNCMDVMQALGVSGSFFTVNLDGQGCANSPLGFFARDTFPTSPTASETSTERACACESRIAFVTSTEYDGNLGGLAGADSKCQASADAAGLLGTYKAWSSDTTTGPATTFAQSSHPYVLTDGTVIARDWADLTDGTLLAPIFVDEAGNSPTTTATWTNTAPDGTPNNPTGDPTQDSCTQWQSTVGNARVGNVGALGSNWTDIGLLQCSINLGRLFCFQQ